MNSGKLELDQPEKSRESILILLVLLAIIAVVKIAVTSQMQTPIILADEAVYDNIAQNMIAGKLSSDMLYCQTYPPGYPLPLSIAYLLPADKAMAYHLMLVINALISTAIIFPAYFILRRYCPATVSIAGSLLIATLPSVSTYTPVLMSENLFTPILMLSLWLMYKQYQTGKNIWQVLLILTLVYMVFIRTIALVILVAYAITLLYEVYTKARSRQVREAADNLLVPGGMLAAALAGLIILRLVFDVDITAYVNRYGDTQYTSHLISALTQIDSMVYFLSLGMHELEYLAIASLFVFALGAIYLAGMLVTAKDQKYGSLAMCVCFAGFSTLFGIVATTTHMYIAHTIDYQVFGRYIDPFVPVIVLFGIIGLTMLGDKKSVLKRPEVIVSLALVTAILFIFTYPHDNYKFGNMFAGFYVNYLSGVIPFYAWIIPALIGAVLLFYLAVNRRKALVAIILLCMVVSTLITAYVYWVETDSSYQFTVQTPIVTYLRENAGQDTIILMDNQTAGTDRGIIMWFAIEFWTGGELIMGPVNDSVWAGAGDPDIQYIITTEDLPYATVVRTAAGQILYAKTPVV